MHEAYLTDYLKENRIRYSVFNILPEHAMYITARMVLNPGLTTPFRNYTMLDNIRYLQDHGGIENLIVCIGHNKDRKSTRLNSSHVAISYAVLCLKKKNDED